MSNKLFFLVALMFFLVHACTEIYDPDISVDKEYLVVESVITDEQGPHIVKITKTNMFGEDFSPRYVGRAVVKLTDTHNNDIYLEERMPGRYHTLSDFSGEIGETYTLHIKTADGETYQSEPQKLLPPVSIDSLYAEFGTQLFFYESQVGGDIYQREVDGMNLFIDVTCDDNKYPKFRFTSVLMLQYTLEHFIGGASEFEYCWIKSPITDFLETDLVKDPDILYSRRNRIAFIPLASWNMRYIGFPLIEKGDKTISYTNPRIIKSVYTLNDDAYVFHYERNKQLGDEGSFFDPIAPQLTGNINNVNDPDDVVLGFFEVSSVSKATLHIIPRVSEDLIEIDTLNCLEHVPASGCIYGETPGWWL